MHFELCPELGEKGHGDSCKSCNGSGQVLMDVTGVHDVGLPYGYSRIDGPTGQPVGRPRKYGKPKVRTEADGAFLYGYKPSGKDDWAREKREREEAAARAARQKR